MQQHRRLRLGHILLALSVILIAMISCGESNGSTNVASTPTTAPSTQVVEQPTDTPTQKPFDWHKLKPTYAKNNTPYYGGRLSDFLGFFGQPTTSDSSTLTWNAGLLWMDGSTSSNTRVSVDYDGNKVIKVSVLDMNQNSTWSMEISKEACIPFEAIGASIYNDTGPAGGTEYLDFHSEIGDFVMAVSPGECSISA
jgi:hypothetical protein